MRGGKTERKEKEERDKRRKKDRDRDRARQVKAERRGYKSPRGCVAKRHKRERTNHP
jgi:hypothetical protein